MTVRATATATAAASDGRLGYDASAAQIQRHEFA